MGLEQGEDTNWKGHKQSGMKRVKETSHTMIVVGVSWLNTFVKIHWIIHLKLVNFMLCKLYLKKADQENSNLYPKLKTHP